MISAEIRAQANARRENGRCIQRQEDAAYMKRMAKLWPKATISRFPVMPPVELVSRIASD